MKRSEVKAQLLGVDKVHFGMARLVLLDRGTGKDGLHMVLVGGLVASDEPFGVKDNKTEMWECEVILVPKRKFRDEEGIHNGSLESVVLGAMGSHPIPFNDGEPYEVDGKPVG